MKKIIKDEEGNIIKTADAILWTAMVNVLKIKNISKNNNIT